MSNKKTLGYVLDRQKKKKKEFENGEKTALSLYLTKCIDIDGGYDRLHNGILYCSRIRCLCSIVFPLSWLVCNNHILLFHKWHWIIGLYVIFRDQLHMVWFIFFSVQFNMVELRIRLGYSRKRLKFDILYDTYTNNYPSSKSIISKR